nr:hypothetical protein HUO10_000898 [Paraburkholderia busanensis]
MVVERIGVQAVGWGDRLAAGIWSQRDSANSRSATAPGAVSQ